MYCHSALISFVLFFSATVRISWTVYPLHMFWWPVCVWTVLCVYKYTGVSGGKVNILGGHSFGHSKKKSLYEHVSYSERFPIFGAQYFPSLPPQ
jgi:hypothetical protein